MTTVVLAHPGDRLAGDVARSLRRGGPVTVTTPALLTQSLTYRHEAGVVTWSARLPGGELRSTQVTGVLNRARYLGCSGFADADDNRYAGTERSALLAAMLAALEVPVLNRPNGAGLAGPTSSGTTLLARAARAGLPVAPLSHRQPRLPTPAASSAHSESAGCSLRAPRLPTPAASSAHSESLALTVVGDRLVADGGDVPPGWAAPALALAARTGCGLLSLPVVHLDGMPCLAAVDPWPRSLEPQALAHLVDLLAPAPDARSSRHTSADAVPETPPTPARVTP